MLTMSTGRDKEARYLQVLSSKGLKLGATENQIQLAIWVGPELAALCGHPLLNWSYINYGELRCVSVLIALKAMILKL